MMNTTVQEFENKFVATLEGELDTAAAVEAEEVLKTLYTTNGKDVEIECEKLEYISSSGLRIWVKIMKGAKACGSRIVLKGLNNEIKHVLSLTGLLSLFEFE